MVGIVFCESLYGDFVVGIACMRKFRFRYSILYIAMTLWRDSEDTKCYIFFNGTGGSEADKLRFAERRFRDDFVLRLKF